MATTRRALSPNEIDRAAGVLYGLACGDALGAPYEFEPPRVNGETVDMVGGGSFGWEKGEWTDDTSMAICIAEVAAKAYDLRDEEALDLITQRFVEWSGEANDVGIQTRRVLNTIKSEPTAANARKIASDVFEETGLTGNGSLMRTAPVALAYLDDEPGLRLAARSVSELTHGDADASEACVLWCSAIAHAVRNGNFDGLWIAVGSLSPDRQAVWRKRLTAAETKLPHEFASNGWVVSALQAAWSAIYHTPVPVEDETAGTFPAQHYALAVEAAVRAGNDTDTVAAIAGGLLGARWGASAIPLSWQRVLHGWPGLRARDLIRLAVLITQHGEPESHGWPSGERFNYHEYPWRGVCAQHPADPNVILTGVEIMQYGGVPASMPSPTAVVSLCRLGTLDAPMLGVEAGNHVEVWLLDSHHEDVNPHFRYVLHQAAAMVNTMRAEGEIVLLHCVQAQSRTPTVASLYASRYKAGGTLAEAYAAVHSAMPHTEPNARFRAYLNDADTAV